MQSDLLNELLSTVDTKIFTLVLQLIVVGAIFMWIKDMNTRVVSFMKLKMSDFGRGTQIKIDGQKGHIHYIGFNEVEIDLGGGDTLLVPVDKFINSSKVISTRSEKC